MIAEMAGAKAILGKIRPFAILLLAAFILSLGLDVVFPQAHPGEIHDNLAPHRVLLYLRLLHCGPSLQSGARSKNSLSLEASKYKLVAGDSSSVHG